MAAGHVDLVIDQGEDWTVQLYWTDYYNDPHRVTAPMRMQIKSPLGQVVADLYTPDAAWPAGEVAPILYNSDTGWIQLHIPATQTDTIAPGNYFYDLFVNIDDGEEYVGTQSVRLITGNVSVSKRITPAGASA